VGSTSTASPNRPPGSEQRREGELERKRERHAQEELAQHDHRQAGVPEGRAPGRVGIAGNQPGGKGDRQDQPYHRRNAQEREGLCEAQRRRDAQAKQQDGHRLVGDPRDHPGAQQDEQHRRHEQLGHVAQRHFLHLRRYLQDADQHADDQRGEQHRPGDDQAVPQHVVEQIERAVGFHEIPPDFPISRPESTIRHGFVNHNSRWISAKANSF
jgi:hypothetical protein